MTEEVHLRRIFRVVSGGTPAADSENWGGRIIWITPADLGRNDAAWIRDSARTLTDQGLRSGSSLVPARSLVLSIRAPIGHLAITEAPVAFSQGCKGLVPLQELDERFFYYQLLSKRRELQGRGQGSTFVELSTEAVSSVRLSAPPLSEQRRIADLLDDQTARIERLIGLERALLSKLPPRTRAVTHAVLATLPRNARLGFAVKWLSGGTPPRDDPANWSGGVPWVSSKDLGSDRLRDTLEHVHEEAGRSYSTLAPTRSVLVATRGMSLAKRLPLAIIDRPMTFNQDLKALVPIKPLDGEYLRVVLRAFEAEILSLVLESAHGTRRLETSDLKALKFPLPSAQEQERRVDEVAEIEDGNGALANRITRHIKLLAERRDAVITAAVTGQLDLSHRESAVPA